MEEAFCIELIFDFTLNVFIVGIKSKVDSILKAFETIYYYVKYL